MTYVDGSSVNIRPNCPMTYTHSSADFDAIELRGSGTTGVDGRYRIKLKDAVKEVFGTYVVNIDGQGTVGMRSMLG